MTANHLSSVDRGFQVNSIHPCGLKDKIKNSIGVQRFVGDAKQTLEIRVERRGNRQGENRGEKSILINERLFAFFLHLYYYFKEVRQGGGQYLYLLSIQTFNSSLYVL